MPHVEQEFKAIHIRSGKWTEMRTSEGYLGLAPPTAEKGDRISAFRGGKAPMILRKTEAALSSWTLVGEGYVHGIMRGEAFEEERCGPICRNTSSVAPDHFTACNALKRVSR